MREPLRGRLNKGRRSPSHMWLGAAWRTRTSSSRRTHRRLDAGKRVNGRNMKRCDLRTTHSGVALTRHASKKGCCREVTYHSRLHRCCCLPPVIRYVRCVRLQVRQTRTEAHTTGGGSWIQQQQQPAQQSQLHRDARMRQHHPVV